MPHQNVKARGAQRFASYILFNSINPIVTIYREPSRRNELVSTWSYRPGKKFKNASVDSSST
jgi:hypothetical protein